MLQRWEEEMKFAADFALWLALVLSVSAVRKLNSLNSLEGEGWLKNGGCPTDVPSGTTS